MLFRNTLALASLTLLLSTTQGFGQAAGTPAQEQPSAPTPQAPAAPPAAPAAPKGPPPFPLVDRANFTATTPTLETVNAFLKASWGYDPNRVWQVQAIEKTVVPGLSKVQVLVEEKGSQQQQPAALAFMVLPDGTHLIASEDVLPFGPDPFAEHRKVLQTRADGPSRGASAKSLELVEFSDFQCPHCKDAQPTIEKLLKDFPSAHFVYENFPLTAIHSEALKAAEYGTCVAKDGGNDAFFKFSDNIFANQVKLVPDGSTAALNDAATAAGQDPAKIAACAALPATKASVDASVQLAKDLGVYQTPWLFINGRGLPLGGVPYDTLKQIISFQMQLDGATATP
jgi:protein-disulfide isomerase